MALHDNDIPAHPIPVYGLTITYTEEIRHSIGMQMAKEYEDAGRHIRDSMSGPKDAMRQSEPYFTHASAWECWALGHEKWVAFCDNNREYLNKVRLHFGWDPLPVNSGKKTKTAPKSKKSR